MTRRPIADVLKDMGLDPVKVIATLANAGYAIGELQSSEPSRHRVGAQGTGQFPMTQTEHDRLNPSPPKRSFNARFAAHPGKRGFDSRFD